MSKKLVPMSIALTSPTDPRILSYPVSVMQDIRSKLDMNHNPVLKSFVAGSVSGTFSTIIFQPLDLIKTKIQQSLLVTPNGVSMLNVTRHVLATENVLGFWRGIMPSITRTVPGVGIHFGSLHLLKTNLNVDESSALQTLALGMIARCVAGTAMIPITVVKTRFESGSFGYSRISSALVSIYRTEGVRGLCCGLLPTLIRDAPFSGIYLMFYTQLKRQVSTYTESTSSVHFACGITAGLLASAVTHPADVIKTRMQLNTGVHKSILSVVTYIVKENGIGGLFAGVAPRMIRRSLMSALTWTVYEKFMKQAGLK